VLQMETREHQLQGLPVDHESRLTRNSSLSSSAVLDEVMGSRLKGIERHASLRERKKRTIPTGPEVPSYSLANRHESRPYKPSEDSTPVVWNLLGAMGIWRFLGWQNCHVGETESIFIT
jgi:hypothetical protein